MRIESDTGFVYDSGNSLEPIGFQKVLEGRNTESGEVLELQMYDPDLFDSIFNMLITSYEEGNLKLKSGIESPDDTSGYIPPDDFDEVKEALENEGFDIAIKLTGSEAYLAQLKNSGQ